jgi:cytochrome c biogenesis protein CcmG, thiol:disulfide interchange protein DsbE
MKRFVLSIAVPIAVALSAAPVLALNVGDAVDPAVLAQLKVDPAKLTVIDFFAEWCGSCRKELPLVSATHARVDAQKVAFLGVDTSDDVNAGVAFQAEMRAKGGLSFATVSDAQQLLVKAFKPKGYPALYILKEGKIVKAHLGAMPNVDQLLAADFKELLGSELAQLPSNNGKPSGATL